MNSLPGGNRESRHPQNESPIDAQFDKAQLEKVKSVLESLSGHATTKFQSGERNYSIIISMVRRFLNEINQEGLTVTQLSNFTRDFKEEVNKLSNYQSKSIINSFCNQLDSILPKSNLDAVAGEQNDTLDGITIGGVPIFVEMTEGSAEAVNGLNTELWEMFLEEIEVKNLGRLSGWLEDSNNTVKQFATKIAQAQTLDQREKEEVRDELIMVSREIAKFKKTLRSGTDARDEFCFNMLDQLSNLLEIKVNKLTTPVSMIRQSNNYATIIRRIDNEFSQLTEKYKSYRADELIQTIAEQIAPYNISERLQDANWQEEFTQILSIYKELTSGEELKNSLNISELTELMINVENNVRHLRRLRGQIENNLKDRKPNAEEINQQVHLGYLINQLNLANSFLRTVKDTYLVMHMQTQRVEQGGQVTTQIGFSRSSIQNGVAGVISPSETQIVVEQILTGETAMDQLPGNKEEKDRQSFGMPFYSSRQELLGRHDILQNFASLNNRIMREWLLTTISESDDHTEFNGEINSQSIERMTKYLYDLWLGFVQGSGWGQKLLESQDPVYVNARRFYSEYDDPDLREMLQVLPKVVKTSQGYVPPDSPLFALSVLLVELHRDSDSYYSQLQALPVKTPQQQAYLEYINSLIRNDVPQKIRNIAFDLAHFASDSSADNLISATTISVLGDHLVQNDRESGNNQIQSWENELPLVGNITDHLKKTGFTMEELTTMSEKIQSFATSIQDRRINEETGEVEYLVVRPDSSMNYLSFPNGGSNPAGLYVQRYPNKIKSLGEQVQVWVLKEPYQIFKKGEESDEDNSQSEIQDADPTRIQISRPTYRGTFEAEFKTNQAAQAVSRESHEERTGDSQTRNQPEEPHESRERKVGARWVSAREYSRQKLVQTPRTSQGERTLERLRNTSKPQTPPDASIPEQVEITEPFLVDPIAGSEVNIANLIASESSEINLANQTTSENSEIDTTNSTNPESSPATIETSEEVEAREMREFREKIQELRGDFNQKIGNNSIENGTYTIGAQRVVENLFTKIEYILQALVNPRLSEEAQDYATIFQSVIQRNVYPDGVYTGDAQENNQEFDSCRGYFEQVFSSEHSGKTYLLALFTTTTSPDQYLTSHEKSYQSELNAFFQYYPDLENVKKKLRLILCFYFGLLSYWLNNVTEEKFNQKVENWGQAESRFSHISFENYAQNNLEHLLILVNNLSRYCSLEQNDPPKDYEKKLRNLAHLSKFQSMSTIFKLLEQKGDDMGFNSRFCDFIMRLRRAMFYGEDYKFIDFPGVIQQALVSDDHWKAYLNKLDQQLAVCGSELKKIINSKKVLNNNLGQAQADQNSESRKVDVDKGNQTPESNVEGESLMSPSEQIEEIKKLIKTLEIRFDKLSKANLELIKKGVDFNESAKLVDDVRLISNELNSLKTRFPENAITKKLLSYVDDYRNFRRISASDVAFFTNRNNNLKEIVTNEHALLTQLIIECQHIIAHYQSQVLVERSTPENRQDFIQSFDLEINRIENLINNIPKDQEFSLHEIYTVRKQYKEEIGRIWLVLSSKIYFDVEILEAPLKGYFDYIKKEDFILALTKSLNYLKSQKDKYQLIVNNIENFGSLDEKLINNKFDIGPEVLDFNEKYTQLIKLVEQKTLEKYYDGLVNPIIEELKVKIIITLNELENLNFLDSYRHPKSDFNSIDLAKRFNFANSFSGFYVGLIHYFDEATSDFADMDQVKQYSQEVFTEVNEVPLNNQKTKQANTFPKQILYKLLLSYKFGKPINSDSRKIVYQAHKHNTRAILNNYELASKNPREYEIFLKSILSTYYGMLKALINEPQQIKDNLQKHRFLSVPHEHRLPDNLKELSNATREQYITFTEQSLARIQQILTSNAEYHSFDQIMQTLTALINSDFWYRHANVNYNGKYVTDEKKIEITKVILITRSFHTRNKQLKLYFACFDFMVETVGTKDKLNAFLNTLNQILISIRQDLYK